MFFKAGIAVCSLVFTLAANAQQATKTENNDKTQQHYCSIATGEVLSDDPSYTPTKTAIEDCQKQIRYIEKWIQQLQCTDRYTYREDGTDDPVCAGIPPNVERVAAAKQLCKNGATASYCGRIIVWPPPKEKKVAAATAAPKVGRKE